MGTPTEAKRALADSSTYHRVPLHFRHTVDGSKAAPPTTGLCSFSLGHGCPLYWTFLTSRAVISIAVGTFDWYFLADSSTYHRVPLHFRHTVDGSKAAPPTTGLGISTLYWTFLTSRAVISIAVGTFDWYFLPLRRWALPGRLCRKCQKPGHIQSHCSNDFKCGHCADGHPTWECGCPLYWTFLTSRAVISIAVGTFDWYFLPLRRWALPDRG
jgi:hypothetical protein